MMISGGGSFPHPTEEKGGIKRKREEHLDKRPAKRQKREPVSWHALAELSDGDFKKIPNVYRKIQNLLSSIIHVDRQIAADLEAIEKKVSLNPNQTQLAQQIKKLAQRANVSKSQHMKELKTHEPLVNALSQILKEPITSMEQLTQAIQKLAGNKTERSALLKNKDLSRNSILLIAEVLGLKERFLQLEEALKPGLFEKKLLYPGKILRQAIFIELLIPEVDATAKKIISSQEAPRAIHIDREKKLIAVLPKPQKDKTIFAAIQAQGTSKKVVSAAAIAFEAAQSPLPPIVQITPIANTKKILAGIEQELAIYEELAGIDGILGVISVTDESSPKGSDKQKSIIATRAIGGDLQKVIKEKQDIPLETQINWAFSLFSTFSAIHKRGYIHGDIKSDNILLGIDKQPLVTDFGMTFKDTPHSMFEENLYGTMEYSAPELFCRPDSDKFIKKATSLGYQKTESFALGCVLYAIYAKEDPPWMKPIVSNRDSENPDWSPENTQHLQKIMEDGIQDCIETPLKHLHQNPEELTRQEHYMWVIYNCMRRDPKKRWTMDDACKYISMSLLPH